MDFDHEQILAHLFAARTRLCATAYSVVRDPQVAEDIFQNPALKAVTKDVSFEHQGALLSWAMVTARREGIDWLRKRRPETIGLEEKVLDLLHEEWLGEEPSSDGRERMEALKVCLQQLPDSSRRMLELRYFEKQSCSQVAAPDQRRTDRSPGGSTSDRLSGPSAADEVQSNG
ncbi:MAG: sigma-70 family RNA polymerase sigma factor [Verrucomicrobiota bacterium]